MMKIYLGSLERRNANNSYVFLFAHRLYLPNVEKDRNVSLHPSFSTPIPSLADFGGKSTARRNMCSGDFLGEKWSRDCVNLTYYD